MEADMLDKAAAENKENTAKKVDKKREKFVQLAENRTRNAIRAIRVIAKLGNRNAYDYSEADVKKIAAALNREMEALKARMTSSGGKESVDFTL
jgi:predicted helicase